MIGEHIDNNDFEEQSEDDSWDESYWEGEQFGP